MSVKLYNVGPLPDNVLYPVLALAKRLVGCKGDVIAKVTRGGYRSRSVALRACGVRKFALGTRYEKQGSMKLVPTDGGWVILRPYTEFPITRHTARGVESTFNKDGIRIAEYLFSTACHEFAHVKEFQEGATFGKYNLRWKNRPHEVRAVFMQKEAVKKALTRPEYHQAIFDLAVEIEAHYNRA